MNKPPEPLRRVQSSMNLKEYVEKLSELFNQPDIEEATFDIGIVMVNGEPIVNESSPNRVKFTVKRESKKCP